MPEFDIVTPMEMSNERTGSFRTIHNRIIAFELGHEYYDGARENGYGGYRYDGRWRQIVPVLMERYGLTSSSSVLDVGCKKGSFCTT